MKTIVVALCFSALLFAGCGQKNAPIVKGAPPNLEITNLSEETVYFVAYPAHAMAYVTIRPVCTEENAIKPGATKSIPYETLLQTGKDEEAVVYWWRCDEGKHETGIGNAHLIRVKL